MQPKLVISFTGETKNANEHQQKDIMIQKHHVP